MDRRKTIVAEPQYPERTSYDHAEHQNTNTQRSVAKYKPCLTKHSPHFYRCSKTMQLGSNIVGNKQSMSRIEKKHGRVTLYALPTEDDCIYLHS